MPYDDQSTGYYVFVFVLFLLGVLWALVILIRLGQIRNLLQTMNKRQAFELKSRNLSMPSDEADDETATYQGMEIEETDGGVLILHAPDGLKRFPTRDALDDFLEKHYPPSGERP